MKKPYCVPAVIWLANPGIAHKPNYRLYERLKLAWLEQHPYATSSEYEAAMRAFAARAGL